MLHEHLSAERNKRIDLWLVRQDDIDQSMIDRYRSIIRHDELGRANSFRFERDRNRYIITRTLVRTVLSRYAPIDPSDWNIKPDKFGRPQISNEDSVAKRLVFNLSHTDGLIVLVVRWDRAVGVDVENILRFDWQEEIYQCLSRAEQQELRLLPPAIRAEQFLRYWTLKESYIKARGKGLSIPLKSFTVSFTANNEIEMAIANSMEDNALRWLFWQYRPTDAHVLSVCAEYDCSPPEVFANDIIPLSRENVRLLVPDRMSALLSR